MFSVRRSCLTLASISSSALPLGTFSSFTLPPSRHDDVDGGEDHTEVTEPKKNLLLEAVKSAGLSRLRAQTSEIASSPAPRRPLFDDEDSSPGGVGRPSVDQLREAARIERTLLECLARYSERQSTFSIRGEPIDIVDVEVSPDLKQARAFWTLPYSFLSLGSSSLNSAKRAVLLHELRRRMQLVLDEKGSKLQGMVHSRLRSYYPPKIKFVPADEDALGQAVRDAADGAGRGRRQRTMG